MVSLDAAEIHPSLRLLLLLCSSSKCSLPANDMHPTLTYWGPTTVCAIPLPVGNRGPGMHDGGPALAAP